MWVSKELRQLYMRFCVESDCTKHRRTHKVFGRSVSVRWAFGEVITVAWWRQAATQSDEEFKTPAVRPAVAGALCVPVQTNTQWSLRSLTFGASCMRARLARTLPAMPILLYNLYSSDLEILLESIVRAAVEGWDTAPT